MHETAKEKTNRNDTAQRGSAGQAKLTQTLTVRQVFGEKTHIKGVSIMTVRFDDFQSFFSHFGPGPHIGPDGQSHPPVGTLAQTIAATYGIDWTAIPADEALARTQQQIAARAHLVAVVRAHREATHR